MNQDIKQRWVAALRSGEYLQGRNALRQDGAFCCLGVLCDLHAKETGNAWTGLENHYFGASGALPPEVRDWAGLSRGNPEMGKGKSLAGINDSGVSFSHIADLIEAQL